jgi:hypothetical protein
MTRKEIDTVLQFGNSHLSLIEGLPIGISKWQVFLSIKPLLKGKKYWYALSSAYGMSDNLFHYRTDVRLAFSNNEPQREYLMSNTERTYLNRLPEKITIYRAMTENELKGKSFGVSWTLKKEVAEFFAKEYQRNYSTKHLKKVVHQMTIGKSEVIAFFNSRQEFEIIYIKESENKMFF